MHARTHARTPPHTHARAMAAKGIEQRHLFLLYQSVVLSLIAYGLGLTTWAQTNLLKLDRVQNEAMRVILGTTKDKPTETMRFMLDLPPMQTRQKVEQVKAYFSAVKIPTTHSTKLSKTKGCRLGWDKSWMGQAEDPILQVCQLTSQANQGVGKVPRPIPASLRDTPARKLGKALLSWPAGKTVRNQASHSRKQQIIRPHSVH